MAETLEGQFTQEDIDNISTLMGEATRMIGKIDPTFDTNRVVNFVEGLRPYAKDGNFAQITMDILTKMYEERTGEKYSPKIST